MTHTNTNTTPPQTEYTKHTYKTHGDIGEFERDLDSTATQSSKGGGGRRAMTGRLDTRAVAETKDEGPRLATTPTRLAGSAFDTVLGEQTNDVDGTLFHQRVALDDVVVAVEDQQLSFWNANLSQLFCIIVT